MAATGEVSLNEQIKAAERAALAASAVEPTVTALATWRVTHPYEYERLSAKERALAVEVDHMLGRTAHDGHPCSLCAQVRAADQEILFRVLAGTRRW